MPGRGRAVRILLAVPIGIVFLLSTAVPDSMIRDYTGSRWLGDLAGGIGPFLLALPVARMVSYRRRDALIFLATGIGAIGVAPLAVRFVWRLTALPYRAWPLRSDEIAAGVQTSHQGPAEPDPEDDEDESKKEPEARTYGPSWSRDVTQPGT